MDKRKRLLIAELCILSCVLVNIIELILSGFSVFRIAAIVLGIASIICFIIEEIRMENRHGKSNE